jgi:hypothetical protein
MQKIYTFGVKNGKKKMKRLLLILFVVSTAMSDGYGLAKTHSVHNCHCGSITVDGIGLMLQAPFSGPASKHLTGVPAVGDDMIDGYISTVTTVFPFTKIIRAAGYTAKGGVVLLKAEQRTLQHMFGKHAKDFGVTGNWSKSMAGEFESVLRSHMQGLNPIRGTYRGTQQVLHYYNLTTRLNVMTDMSGNLVGGWRLSTDQIKHFLSTGTIK